MTDDTGFAVLLMDEWTPWISLDALKFWVMISLHGPIIRVRQVR